VQEDEVNSVLAHRAVGVVHGDGVPVVSRLEETHVAPRCRVRGKWPRGRVAAGRIVALGAADLVAPDVGSGVPKDLREDPVARRGFESDSLRWRPRRGRRYGHGFQPSTAQRLFQHGGLGLDGTSGSGRKLSSGHRWDEEQGR
jgi:hypothetical protein